jgi:pilus assembly protein CpaE
MRASRSAAAAKPTREGILAVMQHQTMLDRVQEMIRELQLDDELVVTDTLDAALRRIRSGSVPRVLLLDLAEASAPISEVSSVRSIGGAELKLVALGNVNDVSLFRDLLAAGCNDYLVKPSTRQGQAAPLAKGCAPAVPGVGGRGPVSVCVWSPRRSRNIPPR